MRGEPAVLRLPPHGRRLSAFVIDSAFPVVILATFSTAVALRVWKASNGWTLGVVVLLVLFVESTNGLVTWLSGGATVGKAWARLRVMHMDERPIDPALKELPKVLARYTFGYVCIDVLLLGNLNALRDPRRRPLHDFILGYEVVAVSDLPASAHDRLGAFSGDLAAGRQLLREKWGWLGAVLSGYLVVQTNIALILVLVFERLGPSAATGSQVATEPISTAPATVPTAVIAGGVAAGGTALTAAVLVASGAFVGADTTTYPHDLRLVAALQGTDHLYPLGLPPDIRLELRTTLTATAVELSELPPAVAAARHAGATVTIDGGRWDGRSFTFDDVLVPTKWRPRGLLSTDLQRWRELQVTEDDNGFIPEGVPIDRYEPVGDQGHGYRVISPGSLTIAFVFAGDGDGHIEELGVELTWSGNVQCVVVSDEADDCPNLRDEVFWVWGVNGVHLE